MPSMGGSATLISAPHLGDLLDVDMSTRVDQCVPSWQASAAKYEPLLGVVGDGASGIEISQRLVAGGPTLVPAHTLTGGLVINCGDAQIAGGPQVGNFSDAGTLTDDTILDRAVINFNRIYDRTGHVLTEGAVVIYVGSLTGDGTEIPASELTLQLQNHDGNSTVSANYAGGLGLFGHAPPVARPAITGALSTVADAPAKAVLTSIIAALVGCGLASNGTT